MQPDPRYQIVSVEQSARAVESVYQPGYQGYENLDRLPAGIRALVNEHGEISVAQVMRMFPGCDLQALTNGLEVLRRRRQKLALAALAKPDNVLTDVTTPATH